MVLGGVAAAFVVGVGLDDDGVRQLLPDKVFDPGAGDDVRAIRLTGVQLDANLTGEAPLLTRSKIFLRPSADRSRVK